MCSVARGPEPSIVGSSRYAQQCVEPLASRPGDPPYARVIEPTNGLTGGELAAFRCHACTHLPSAHDDDLARLRQREGHIARRRGIAETRLDVRTSRCAARPR